LDYCFDALLDFTRYQDSLKRKDWVNKNPLVRLFKKFFPVTKEYHGGKLCKVNGREFATLLFIVCNSGILQTLIFAVDSIPAILAITNDTLLFSF
jgi:tellurite resistance protein TerC